MSESRGKKPISEKQLAANRVHDTKFAYDWLEACPPSHQV
jgi:hypothetical protein